MVYLAPRLNRRIQIVQPVDTENDSGGFDRSYTTLLTIWGSLKPLSMKSSYIRGVQITDSPTHEIEVRRSSVDSLGVAFSKAFSTAFDTIADLNPLKSDYYILVQRGSTVKGRLFRIHNYEDVQERRAYLKLFAEEIEEQATGYQS